MPLPVTISATLSENKCSLLYTCTWTNQQCHSTEGQLNLWKKYINTILLLAKLLLCCWMYCVNYLNIILVPVLRN